MSSGRTLEDVRAAVTERLGLLLDRGPATNADTVLRARIERVAGGSAERYLALLGGQQGAPEIRSLAERLTVGETYFFRNSVQLSAFAEVMLPACAPRAQARGRLSILSAGCSTGEEPYTLAMIVRERLPALAASTRITGFDVNASAIEKARRACYTEWSLRQVPQAVRDREFERVGREHCVHPSSRALVTLREANLVDEAPELWGPDQYDIIFFRNVAMYLSPSAYEDVVGRCARSLTAGGFLVLGDAESLRGVSSAFDLRHTQGAFYYQLRRRGVSGGDTLQPGRGEVIGPSLLGEGTWVEAIGRASARITALADRPSAPVPAAPAWNLNAVVELLRQERLDAAHRALDGLPPDAALDPDVLLLRAVVLTNRGLVAEAEATCVRLLELDGLNAGAHYLHALCREHQGDPVRAAEADQAAVHLDPSFAMPRLHLALLADHAGRREEARQEFARAVELIAREDSARVLMFGGGFTREALLSLCQARL